MLQLQPSASLLPLIDIGTLEELSAEQLAEFLALREVSNRGQLPPTIAELAARENQFRQNRLNEKRSPKQHQRIDDGIYPFPDFSGVAPRKLVRPHAAPSPSFHVINLEQATRFLKLAQLSASEDEVYALQRKGYAAWLNQQMSTQQDQSGWGWLIAKEYNDASKDNLLPADYMMWNQFIRCRDTLRKRVAVALSEVFAISCQSLNMPSGAFAIAAYWDLLVQHAFGNYRQLLEAVALNPLVGHCLKTKGSIKERGLEGKRPSEDFALELVERYTVGLYNVNEDASFQLDANGHLVEAFDPDTITNVAYAMTGWDFDYSGASSFANPLQNKLPMKFYASRHTTLPLVVLDVTIPANTDGRETLRIVLDVLFSHPNVGPFISKQLIQRLVTSKPSSAYVARVSDIFNDNGAGVKGDLASVVRAIYLDPEVVDGGDLEPIYTGKLSENMIQFIAWARDRGASLSNDDWLINRHFWR